MGSSRLGKLPTKKELLELQYAYDSHVPGPSGHDRIAEAVHTLVSRFDVAAIRDGFLGSLGSSNVTGIAGLGAFSVGRVLPDHDYAPWMRPDGPHEGGPCRICGVWKDVSEIDSKQMARANSSLHGGSGGGANMDQVYAVLRLLDEQQRTWTPDEQSRGRTVLERAIAILGDLPPDTKFDGAEKAIKPAMGKGRSRLASPVACALFYAGILSASGHPSWFGGFLEAQMRDQRSSYRGYTPYPMDKWRGADGVNEEALAFWFPELVS